LHTTRRGGNIGAYTFAGSFAHEYHYYTSTAAEQWRQRHRTAGNMYGSHSKNKNPATINCSSSPDTVKSRGKSTSQTDKGCSEELWHSTQSLGSTPCTPTLPRESRSPQDMGCTRWTAHSRNSRAGIYDTPQKLKCSTQFPENTPCTRMLPRANRILLHKVCTWPIAHWRKIQPSTCDTSRLPPSRNLRRGNPHKSAFPRMSETTKQRGECRPGTTYDPKAGS